MVWFRPTLAALLLLTACSPDAAPIAPVAPPAPVPAPRSIRVTVMSVDGAPIPGAHVQLFPGPAIDESTDLASSDFRPAIDAGPPGQADSSGSGVAVLTHVPPGRWFVAAQAPGFGRHAVVGVTSTDGAVAASIVLAKGAPFGGTITGRDGRPSRGVAVVLAPASFSTLWPNDAGCLRTFTGADGAYLFDAVEPGEYRIWYSPQPDLLLPADFVRVPALDRYDIALADGGVIEGTIGDVDAGEPFVNAQVLAVLDAVSYRTESPLAVAADSTDGRGHFKIRTWTPHTAFDRLLVKTPGCAPWPVEGTGRHEEGELETGQRIVIDLRVQRVATLSGTLRGPDGPLAGFRVHVTPEEDWQLPGQAPGGFDAVSAADGRFHFPRLPAGGASLEVYRPQRDTDAVAVKRLTVDAGADVVEDVTVRGSHGTFSHRVVDPDNAPVAGVEVVQDEGGRTTAITDADGRFTMPVNIFADEAKLTLRREGFQEITFAATSDGSDGEDWMLQPVRTVTGTVRDAAGAAVPGVRVELLAGESAQGAHIYRWRGMAETVTGADGTYRLPVTSRDCEYVIARTPSGGAMKNESFDRGSDATVDIELPAGQRVTGRVVAAGGDEPIAGVLVHQTRNGGESSSDVIIGRTSADGRFAVSFAPDAKTSLRFARAGWIEKLLESDALTATVRVELSPSLVIAGVVRLEDGTPVPGTSISATPTDHYEPVYAFTDEAGRFLVHDVAAGEWEVTAYRADDAIIPARPVVKAGDRNVVAVVRRAVPFHVRVEDADGNPVVSAVVSVWAQDDETTGDGDTTDAYGNAQLAALPGALLRVHVSKDGYERFERDDVRGSETLRVVLSPAKPK